MKYVQIMEAVKMRAIEVSKKAGILTNVFIAIILWACVQAQVCAAEPPKCQKIEECITKAAEAQKKEDNDAAIEY